MGTCDTQILNLQNLLIEHWKEKMQSDETKALNNLAEFISSISIAYPSIIDIRYYSMLNALLMEKLPAVYQLLIVKELLAMYEIGIVEVFPIRHYLNLSTALRRLAKELGQPPAQPEQNLELDNATLGLSTDLNPEIGRQLG